VNGRRPDGEAASRVRRASSRPPARRSSRPPPPPPPPSAPRILPAPFSDDEVRQRLERLAALGARSAEVAHELRNALSVLETSLHLAKRAVRGNPDVEQRLVLHFARMAEQIHAGQAIVREALDSTRLGVMERAPVDLRSFLLEVVSAVQRPDSVSVDVEAPAAQVSIDARQIRQLLLNLLRNAFEALAARDGGGAVRVVARVDGGSLGVEIHDDGPGIDPALELRLFQPFATGKRGGTGLGLAVCRRIAEAHGGGIEVRRVEPHGTVMAVDIPLSE
jgi:two-component system sensor histidine kinase PilS (NtrC family)